MEHFIDFEHDTELDILHKRNLSTVLGKTAKNRTFQDIADLNKFFSHYEYFNKLQKEHGDKAYNEIMKIIKIKGVPRDVFLIEEGEEGDKFYLILKGDLEVLKAQEVLIPNMPRTKGRGFIFRYLQYLYDHFDDIHWLYVPYSRAIQAYLHKVHAYKCQLVERIMKDVWVLLGREIQQHYAAALKRVALEQKKNKIMGIFSNASSSPRGRTPHKKASVVDTTSNASQMPVDADKSG